MKHSPYFLLNSLQYHIKLNTCLTTIKNHNRAQSRSDCFNILLLGGVSLCMVTPTYANEVKETKESEAPSAVFESVNIESLSDKEEQLFNKPESIAYISSDDIKRYSPISVGDIFKGQPGVQVADIRNGGGLDFNIRGVQGQSRVAVTVDGTQQALDVYRGYAGTQQRSYINPDLISKVIIHKGAGSSIEEGANGIGGTVAIKTIDVEDVVLPGKNVGIRLTGQLWNNGTTPIKPVRDGSQIVDEEELETQPEHSNRGNILESDAKSGSIAVGYTSDKLDVVAAYAKRKQGNYFTGKKGHEDYRSFTTYYPGKPYEFTVEDKTVAKAYKPGEEVLNSAADTESILLKTTWRPAEGHSIKLGYNNYNSENGEIMPSDIYRSGDAGILQYPYATTEIDRYYIDYKYQPENPLIDLNVGVWQTDAKTNQINAVEGPASEQYIEGYRSWVKMDNQRTGANISNRSTFYTDKGDIHLTLGGSLMEEDIQPQSDVEIKDVDLWANRNYRDAKRFEYDLNLKAEYEVNDKLSLWAGSQYSHYKMKDHNRRASPVYDKDVTHKVILVQDDDRWGYMRWLPDQQGNYTDATDPRLHNGIIYKDHQNPFDGIKIDDFGPHYDNVYDERTSDIITGYTFGEAIEEDDDALSFSAGVKYNFLPNSFIYASYTEGSRMPSLFETSMGTTQVVPIMNETSIDPETSKNWEVGVSSRHTGLFADSDKASFKLTYFNNKIDDYVTRYLPPDMNGVMTFSNTDYYKLEGLELQTNYDAGWGFIDLSATHYLKTETCDKSYAERLRNSGHENLANTPNCTPASYGGSYINTQNPPEYAVNLGLGTRWIEDTLTIGARANYTSESIDDMDKPWQKSATTNQIYYRPVTTYDLYMNYQVSKNSELNFAIQNLTNEYYIDALTQSFMPAPGRTAQLGMTFQF
ncbi:Probable TonB-dependent receptor NMB1497 precursor [Psychrobacter phenylpyruvicus]|uniref:Probable TonB-dependent receptor NMB1497 n=2 Tax=Psychrobacter phenylpyruvicus TaxID=29432 RepID=A0A379LHB7_9GAMM|nr:Probable TonB-dependent receptor NMB1497 precursor [Psychrobacter phenylpyruvicus]